MNLYKMRNSQDTYFAVGDGHVVYTTKVVLSLTILETTLVVA